MDPLLMYINHWILLKMCVLIFFCNNKSTTYIKWNSRLFREHELILRRSISTILYLQCIYTRGFNTLIERSDWTLSVYHFRIYNYRGSWTTWDILVDAIALDMLDYQNIVKPWFGNFFIYIFLDRFNLRPDYDFEF